MIQIPNFFHHYRAVLVILSFSISFVNLDQSSEYFDENSESTEGSPKIYTALAIKEGVKKISDLDGAIAIGPKTYWDLVNGSRVFLDTSLFIEEVLKNYTSATTLLACPNKWGKTMNLDMLRIFLEIQVDQNGNRLVRENTTAYRLFRRNEIVYNNTFVQKLQSPLLISKKTVFVDRHQGKYPVVYFSLKEVIGDDLNSIRERVREALSRTFQPYKYLVNELAKEHHKSELLVLFEQMLYGKAKDEDIPDGIILLCHTLEALYRKKAVVLIDDYDAFIHHLLKRNCHTNDELKQIMKFMVEIVESAFRRNLHMEFGIATGVLQINAYQWQHHNYTVYVNDRNKPISEYFGFTRQMVQDIFYMNRIPKHLANQGHNWYKGYASEEPNKFFFNPWSVANFLRTKTLSCYREEGHHETFIQNVLRSNLTIRNTVLQMLSGMIVSAENRFPFMISDLEGLRLYGSHLTTYLCDKGYLSKISNNPLFNRTMENKLILDSVAIPNVEIAHQISDWMKTYCKEEYNIDPLVFNWAGVFLRNLIENCTDSSLEMEDQKNSIDAFAEALQDVYRNASRLSDKINPIDEYMFATQEHPVHFIFDCICLRMQQETNYEYEVYYKKLLKADIVAINRIKKHAAIIQLKFKLEKPDRAMAHAENYQYVIDEHANEVETVQLIGISVSTNFTVRVVTNLITRSQTTVI